MSRRRRDSGSMLADLDDDDIQILEDGGEKDDGSGPTVGVFGGTFQNVRKGSLNNENGQIVVRIKTEQPSLVPCPGCLRSYPGEASLIHHLKSTPECGADLLPFADIDKKKCKKCSRSIGQPNPQVNHFFTLLSHIRNCSAGSNSRERNRERPRGGNSWENTLPQRENQSKITRNKKPVGKNCPVCFHWFSNSSPTDLLSHIVRNENNCRESLMADFHPGKCPNCRKSWEVLRESGFNSQLTHFLNCTEKPGPEPEENEHNGPNPSAVPRSPSSSTTVSDNCCNSSESSSPKESSKAQNQVRVEIERNSVPTHSYSHPNPSRNEGKSRSVHTNSRIPGNASRERNPSNPGSNVHEIPSNMSKNNREGIQNSNPIHNSNVLSTGEDFDLNPASIVDDFNRISGYEAVQENLLPNLTAQLTGVPFNQERSGNSASGDLIVISSENLHSNPQRNVPRENSHTLSASNSNMNIPMQNFLDNRNRGPPVLNLNILDEVSALLGENVNIHSDNSSNLIGMATVPTNINIRDVEYLDRLSLPGNPVVTPPDEDSPSGAVIINYEHQDSVRAITPNFPMSPDVLPRLMMSPSQSPRKEAPPPPPFLNNCSPEGYRTPNRSTAYPVNEMAPQSPGRDLTTSTPIPNRSSQSPVLSNSSPLNFEFQPPQLREVPLPQLSPFQERGFPPPVTVHPPSPVFPPSTPSINSRSNLSFSNQNVPSQSNAAPYISFARQNVPNANIPVENRDPRISRRIQNVPNANIPVENRDPRISRRIQNVPVENRDPRISQEIQNVPVQNSDPRISHEIQNVPVENSDPRISNTNYKIIPSQRSPGILPNENVAELNAATFISNVPPPQSPTTRLNPGLPMGPPRMIPSTSRDPNSSIPRPPSRNPVPIVDILDVPAPGRANPIDWDAQSNFSSVVSGSSLPELTPYDPDEESFRRAREAKLVDETGLRNRYKHCGYCSIFFKTVYEGMKHYHHIHKELRCPKCLNLFTSRGNAYKDHLKAHFHYSKSKARLDEMISCQFCGNGKRFDYDRIWKHIIDVHVDPPPEIIDVEDIDAALMPPPTLPPPSSTNQRSIPNLGEDLLDNLFNSANSSFAPESGEGDEDYEYGQSRFSFKKYQLKVLIDDFLPDPNGPFKARAEKIALILGLETERIKSWLYSNSNAFKKGKIPLWARKNNIPMFDPVVLPNGKLQLIPRRERRPSSDEMHVGSSISDNSSLYTGPANSSMSESRVEDSPSPQNSRTLPVSRERNISTRSITSSQSRRHDTERNRDERSQSSSVEIAPQFLKRAESSSEEEGEILETDSRAENCSVNSPSPPQLCDYDSDESTMTQLMPTKRVPFVNPVPPAPMSQNSNPNNPVPSPSGGNRSGLDREAYRNPGQDPRESAERISSAFTSSFFQFQTPLRTSRENSTWTEREYQQKNRSESENQKRKSSTSRRGNKFARYIDLDKTTTDDDSSSDFEHPRKRKKQKKRSKRHSEREGGRSSWRKPASYFQSSSSVSSSSVNSTPSLSSFRNRDQGDKSKERGNSREKSSETLKEREKSREIPKEKEKPRENSTPTSSTGQNGGKSQNSTPTPSTSRIGVKRPLERDEGERGEKRKQTSWASDNGRDEYRVKSATPGKSIVLERSPRTESECELSKLPRLIPDSDAVFDIRNTVKTIDDDRLAGINYENRIPQLLQAQKNIRVIRARNPNTPLEGLDLLLEMCASLLVHNGAKPPLETDGCKSSESQPPSKSTSAAAKPSKPAPITASTSKPAPVTASTSKPAPVTASTSKPAPVTASTSKPAPVTASTSKPAPVTVSTSKPAPVTASTSKPAPVTASTSKPAPVKASTSKPAPVTAGTSKSTPVTVQKSKSSDFPRNVYLRKRIPKKINNDTNGNKPTISPVQPPSVNSRPNLNFPSGPTQRDPVLSKLLALAQNSKDSAAESQAAATMASKVSNAISISSHQQRPNEDERIVDDWDDWDLPNDNVTAAVHVADEDFDWDAPETPPRTAASEATEFSNDVADRIDDWSISRPESPPSAPLRPILGSSQSQQFAPQPSSPREIQFLEISRHERETNFRAASPPKDGVWEPRTNKSFGSNRGRGRGNDFRGNQRGKGGNRDNFHSRGNGKNSYDSERGNHHGGGENQRECGREGDHSRNIPPEWGNPNDGGQELPSTSPAANTSVNNTPNNAAEDDWEEERSPNEGREPVPIPNTQEQTLQRPSNPNEGPQMLFSPSPPGENVERSPLDQGTAVAGPSGSCSHLESRNLLRSPNGTHDHLKKRLYQIGIMTHKELATEFRRSKNYILRLQDKFFSQNNEEKFQVFQQTKLLLPLIDHQRPFKNDQRQFIDESLDNDKRYSIDYVQGKSFKKDIVRYWVLIFVYAKRFGISVDEAVMDFFAASKNKRLRSECPHAEIIKNMFLSVK